MALLTAKGNESQAEAELRRRRIAALGPAAPRSGLAIPWDMKISREHAVLTMEKGRLRVSRLPTARNPVRFNGQNCAEFLLAPGEEFEIGSTTIRLSRGQLHVRR